MGRSFAARAKAIRTNDVKLRNCSAFALARSLLIASQLVEPSTRGLSVERVKNSLYKSESYNR
jgi:hypothetical protein